MRRSENISHELGAQIHSDYMYQESIFLQLVDDPYLMKVLWAVSKRRFHHSQDLHSRAYDLDEG